ncbi:MAG: sensor histidine kinase [Paracoccaceae bacterium]|nr:MAG: sensor histidine kinase [Paracoccaceae bacterium]
MRTFLAIVVAITLAWLAPRSSDAAEVLALNGAVPFESVTPHLSVMFDADHSLTPEQAQAMADWAPVAGVQPDFGYRDEAVWLRLRLRNGSADQAEWVLHFHENFKQSFDTWLIREDGRTEHLLALSTSTPFTARPMLFPQMATRMHLEPGEQATVLVRFWSEGSSLLPMSIKTRAGFLETTAVVYARNFVFYGFMAAFIAAALIGSAVFRSVIALAFAAYAGSALLFVMHADGTAFQYLYPNQPGFNSIASVVWGGGFVFLSALYARIFLGTRRDFPRTDAVLLAVMAVCAGLGLAMFFADRQAIKQAFVVVALVGVLTCLVAGLVVARRHFRRVRFFVLAWTGAVVSSTLMNLIHNVGIDMSQDAQTNSMRVVMVIDAGLMGLAILDRYTQMRDRSQAVLRENLAAAERTLLLGRRLAELERQTLALEAAAARKRDQFANVIHDLRQPLHGLRLRVKAEAEPPGGAPTGTAERQAETDRAFDYMESLIQTAAHTLDALSDAPAPRPADDDLSLGAILAAVTDMFAADAAERGLDLRHVPTSVTTAADPLSVLRILCNLVSNAIKYTPTGRVLIGCRRRGGMVSVEVHDTGPGLSAEEFRQATAPEARVARTAANQPGEGRGLAIADAEARAQGGRMIRLPRRGAGLSVAVLLPPGTHRKG